MASLTKRGKSDKWTIIYVDATGKQRWITAYRDKRESQRLAEKLEHEKRLILNGDVDPQAEVRKRERDKPWSVHVEQHIAALRAAGCTSIHAATTEKYLRDFGEWADIVHASQVTRPMVEQYVGELKAGKTGLTRNGKRAPSHRTINARIGALQALLKRLHEQRLLTDYVLLRFPKLKTLGNERRKPRSLTADEVEKLLTVPDRADLYRFCLLSGARHSQATALVAADVNLKAGTLRLRAKDNRHRNDVHIVPIHPELRPMLERRIEERGEAPLLDVPNRSMAARLIRRDCEAAGIDPKGVQFHSLRHTFCTLLATAEPPVHPSVLQALAGHKDLKTTLGYYVHFRRDDERAALALLRA